MHQQFLWIFFFKEDPGNADIIVKKCFFINIRSYFWELGDKTWLMIPS